MKRHTIIILAALLVLGAVGTALAQEPVSVDGRIMPVGVEQFSGPSRFDLAAPWNVIDGQDLLPLRLMFGRYMDETIPYSWDLNRDGVIDIIDIGMVAARDGCTVVDACYWR